MAALLSDGRRRPRIKTPTVFGAVMVMLWARMGSLNALEQTRANRYWKKWLGVNIGSADTHGRVYSLMDREKLRKLLKAMYRQMRRNKALKGHHQGLRALIIDGHEQTASYLKKCSGCLKREIGEEQKARIQYYHRHVTAMLVCGERMILLDCEMQRNRPSWENHPPPDRIRSNFSLEKWIPLQNADKPLKNMPLGWLLRNKFLGG